MKLRFSSAVAMVMAGALAMAVPLKAADLTTRMGGDYKNAIPIPSVSPNGQQIAGALLKPEGSGPFPVVVYIPACGGPNFPLELQQEKFWIEQLRSKGIAIFVVDPFVPRGVEQGVCDKVLTVLKDVQDKNEAVLQLLSQAGEDAVAAVKAVKAMPDIDPSKVFLMGFSYGGTATLYASDPGTAGPHDTELAGVIAYFPLCDSKAEAAAPTLILIGEKDDWTGPPAACEALKSRKNFEVVVYPGATHAYTMAFDKPMDFAGHHMAHDAAATQDSAQRAMAFIEAQLK